MTPPSRILAGAMSGTSADGVDIALVQITGRGLEMTANLLHHQAHPYDAALRNRIFAIRNAGRAELSELAQLAREISLCYAAAVNDALRAANLNATDLAAIAAHGQTLYHNPPNTIQWFDPSLVAAEVGCPVVSDFRRADCAAGGQGAPLVPFADYILFRHPTKNRVLLNIGGIANLTYIPAGGSIEQVIAFDTGPGNCVLDHLMRQSHGENGFDRNGELSMRGAVHFPTAVLSTEAAFFFRRPPKSTDGPEMIRLFEEALLVLSGKSPRLLEDQLATACCAVARAVQQSFYLLPELPAEVVASGGGTCNPRIMAQLRQSMRFPRKRPQAPIEVPVITIDELGIPSAAKEALAFALLGAATLDGIPSNVPSATGAKRSVVLGSITPRP
jgi:anhydro-N-acetylmuramic acid kinase